MKAEVVGTIRSGDYGIAMGAGEKEGGALQFLRIAVVRSCLPSDCM